MAATCHRLVFPAAQEAEYLRRLDKQSARWLFWVSLTLVLVTLILSLRYPEELGFCLWSAVPALLFFTVLLPLRIRVNGITAVFLLQLHQAALLLMLYCAELLGMGSWTPLSAHIFSFSSGLQGIGVTLYGCLLQSVGVPLPWYWHIPARFGCELWQSLYLTFLGWRFDHGIDIVRRFIIRFLAASATGFVMDIVRRRSSSIHASDDAGQSPLSSPCKVMSDSIDSDDQNDAGSSTSIHRVETGTTCTVQQLTEGDIFTAALHEVRTQHHGIASVEGPSSVSPSEQSTQPNTERLMELAQRLVRKDPDWHYVPLTVPTVRVMLKIPDREPEELAPCWQQIMRQGLEQGCGGKVTQMHVRRGCTQIIAEVDVPVELHHQPAPVPVAGNSGFGAGMPTTGLQGLAWAIQQSVMPRLFSSNSAGSMHVSVLEQQLQAASGIYPLPQTSQPVTLQLQQQALVLHAMHSAMGCDTSSTATLTAAALPPSILCLSPAAVPAVSLQKRSVMLKLQLSSPVQEGAVLLTRTADFTTTTKLHACQPTTSGDAWFVEVEYELPQQAGLVQLAIMDDASGLMGPAAPLVVVSCATAAQELCCVQQSTAGVSRPKSAKVATQRASHAGHPFLVDFGRWTGEAVACSTAQSSKGTAEPIAVSHALQVGNGLLQFCLMMDLPACMAVIADLLVDALHVPPASLLHGCGPADWLPLHGFTSSRLFSSPTGLPPMPLLHQAVIYGNTAVAEKLVAWAGRHSTLLDWLLPGPDGLTPMDLLAALPNKRWFLQLVETSQQAACDDAVNNAVGLTGLMPAAAGGEDYLQNSANDSACGSQHIAADNAPVTTSAATAVGPACIPGQASYPMGLPMPWVIMRAMIFVSSAMQPSLRKEGVSYTVMAHLPYIFILLHHAYTVCVAKNRSHMRVSNGATPSKLQHMSDWLFKRNFGLVLHVYRLVCFWCCCIRHHEQPRSPLHGGTLPVWLTFVVILFSQAMESYDVRVASAVICFAHLPLHYLHFSLDYSAPQPAFMAVTQAVVMVAVQWAMAGARAATAAKASLVPAPVGAKARQS